MRLHRPTAVFPVLLLGLFAAAPSAADVPHAFMQDVHQCQRCHETIPDAKHDDFTSVTFKKDIVTLCVECHTPLVNHDKHPVDIRPERPVPIDLHLDNYLSITCVTCHDPHGKAFADFPYVPRTWFDRVLQAWRGEESYRTFFLRKSNTDGELCLSCHTRGSLETGEERTAVAAGNDYAGSQKCAECHAEVHRDWRKTVHARYVGDPGKDPTAVRAVFEEDQPFPPATIRYTLGEHWTQRYVVTGKGGELLVRPEIWSIQTGAWINSGSFSRSWFRYCAGCHTTGFNPYSGTFVETGIGCEACHGPGRSHCETTDQFEIVNPAKLTPVRRDMVCESCHTSGHDRSGQYRFPVGYRPGEDLTASYKGLVPKPGQEADTYSGDGSYEDRHRQFEFWMSRYNITQGELCDVCKNFRQAPAGSEELYLTSSEFCSTCHAWYGKNYRTHCRHTPEQAACIDCHTPLLSRDRQNYSIHDHKFQFGKPVYRQDLTQEQRCGHCHGDKVSLARLGVRTSP